ncbi:hypothetical protein Pcac1_g29360 [Phytophthora cactorum]|nr:hypothetical protein Pcac1_g29360 [Phytophthora cactorum]
MAETQDRQARENPPGATTVASTTSGAMAKFCKDRGIEQKFTPPYTPQLNGVAERMNRTLVECARCMLEARRVVQVVLGRSVMTATFLRNRCPTRAITHDKSPHQVWTGKKPLLANLKCSVATHTCMCRRRSDPSSTRSQTLPFCRVFGARESVSV